MRLPTLLRKAALVHCGDIGGHLEVAEGAAALDVVHAIGDALADEVGQLLDQVGILQQIGPPGPTVSEYSSLGAGLPESVVVGE